MDFDDFAILGELAFNLVVARTGGETGNVEGVSWVLGTGGG